MWTKTIALSSVLLIGAACAANAADLIIEDAPAADLAVVGDWTATVSTAGCSAPRRATIGRWTPSSSVSKATSRLAT
jgi:hypothetical protein